MLDSSQTTPVKSVGLKFIYLINAPFSFEGSKRKEVENYLYWIVNKFKADALMITSYELMEFIRKKYPKIPIFISTIAGIKNAKQLETFKAVFPSRVVAEKVPGYRMAFLISQLSKKRVMLRLKVWLGKSESS